MTVAAPLVEGRRLTSGLVTARLPTVGWRKSPWLRVLAAAAVISLAVAGTSLTDGDRDTRSTAPPPIVEFRAPVGPRLTGPLAVAFVVDDSGSIAGADPHSARAGELAAALRWLAAWGRTDDRVGFVVHVERAAVTVPMSRPSEAMSASPTSLVHGAPAGDGTKFLDAARQANSMLMGTSDATQRIVVFVTDGLGDDVAAAAAALDPSVARYVVGLDGAGGWRQSRKAWERAMGPRETWRVGRIHPGDLADPIAALLSDVTGQKVGTRAGRR